MSEQPTYSMTAPTLHVIAPEHEQMVPVRRAELRELAEQLMNLRNPVQSAAAWAFTWLGIGFGTGVALALALQTDGTKISVGMKATLIALVCLSAFLTLYMFWLDRKLRQSEKSDARRLSQRINEWDRRATLPRHTEASHHE